MFQALRTFSRRWLRGPSRFLYPWYISLCSWAVAHGVITDMVLLYTTLMVMMYAYKGLNENSSTAMIVAYVFSGLGVLTKPAGRLVSWPYFLLVYVALCRSEQMLLRLFDWKGFWPFLSSLCRGMFICIAPMDKPF